MNLVSTNLRFSVSAEQGVTDSREGTLSSEQRDERVPSAYFFQEKISKTTLFLRTLENVSTSKESCRIKGRDGNNLLASKQVKEMVKLATRITAVKELLY